MDDPPSGFLTPLEGRLIQQALAERMLLWTVPDLRSRARPDATHYETLGLAPVLRRTISDKNSAVHAARQRLGLPLPVFECTPHVLGSQPPADPATGDEWTLYLSFAAASFTQPAQRMSLKQFLAAPAAFFEGEPVSVHRVIDYFAHVEGGVHLGRPSDRFEEVVQKMVASSDFMGNKWARALSAIALVTARALDPLTDAIGADPIRAAFVSAGTQAG